MTATLRGVARLLFILVVAGAVGLGSFIGISLVYFGRDLPNHQQLVNYVPAIGSKIYASDGAFMAEFASEHRIAVSIKQVPRMLIQAILAAEDRDFYTHNGVNPTAIFRAAVADLTRFQRGQRPIGASTITQQVVRHFLLSNEVSVTRKIKEALLAYRIEHELSKDRILEIYLNEIYLGAGAYGVATAADTYFQKPLDNLTVAETAFIAALPKAPANYNPVRYPQAAKARRDWVLAGMAETGAITPEQAKAAMAEPLGVHLREPEGEPPGYFLEEVRRELVGRFGEKAVYQGGLAVRTSYMPGYQQKADKAFRDGLIEYDRRHGWRGPITHLSNAGAAQNALAGMADPPGTAGWELAAVMAVEPGAAHIVVKNGGQGRIPLGEMRWARKTLDDQRLGAGIGRASQVLQPGDIILVEPIGSAASPSGRRGAAQAITQYALRQIPDVSGGLVTMDPKSGRVFAMVGGWSFQQSQFNRVTQAKRQPGSAFKPFVYVTALENGYSPFSVVEDAPISIPQGPGMPPWEPVNYEGSYVGETTLSDALVHSRNLVTARLAVSLGLPAIARTVQNFDVMDKMPLYYSMSLGAGETTLLRLTSAYAMIDNGGHWLLPSVVDSVQDRQGRVIYQKGVKDCAACFVAAAPATGAAADPAYKVAGAPPPGSVAVPNTRFIEDAVMYKPTKPDPLISDAADREIIAMMQGVVERGTGTAVAAVGKPLAGKTGTTSDWFDAWFVGFSPDLAAGVFVGFDEPRTLGGGEVGGHVAAPIFRDFMMAALKNVPSKPFPEAPSASAAVAANVLRGAPDDDPDQTASLTPPDANAPPEVLRDGRARPSRMPADEAARPDQSQSPYWPPVPRAYAAPYTGGAYGSTYPPGYPSPYRQDYSYAPPRDYGSQSPYSYAAPYTAPRSYGSPGQYPGYPTTGYDAPGGYPPAQSGGYPTSGWRPGRGTGGLY
ncbi:MAG: PBP1A family penicillin-binding protein [Alphaproteobacteria bacterium]|nr:PBP1A family penicillin-binding protein [Alphaproteobacteria bacterium]